MTPDKIGTFGQLFSVPYLFEVLAVALVMTTVYLFAARAHFQVLQQSSYRTRAFLGVAVTGKTLAKDRLRLATTLGFLSFLLVTFAFSFSYRNFISFLGFIPCIGFFVWFIFLEAKKIKKVPLKNTPRMVRLKALTAIMIFAFTFGIAVGANAVAYAVKDGSVTLARYLPVVLFPYLIPFVIALANIVLVPIERLLARRFIRRAKATIAASAVTVIGITGSYGKTSVKSALATMLSKRFRVLETPASYNTPLGISRAVEGGLEGVDIFIAEMGARRRGDIARLSEMVKPTVGVVTAVGLQHMQTFKTEQNVLSTKGELPAAMPADGFMVFGDDEGCRALHAACACDKAFAPKIKDVRVTEQGTEFTLQLKSGDAVCTTDLLGEHNLNNLALCAAVCERLGMEGWEIAAGIREVKAAPHRLQKMRTANGWVIDDSYNANPVGAAGAINALKAFGGRKIVVTPGFVELGKQEKQQNYALGKQLAAVDKVYAVGLLRARPIIDGLLDSGFDKKQIVAVASLEEAKEKLAKDAMDGDVVLFLNDLPDLYDE